MYLLAHVAELASEQHLHLRMDVLYVVFYHEFTTLAQLVDGLQLVEQHRQLVLANQPDALEHRNVGHGTQHVVFCQIEIHLTVTTDGEPLNLLVYLEILLPKLHASL